MPFLGSVEGQFAFGRKPTATQGLITSNMLLYLDAGNAVSYSGSGTTWTDLSPSANNATNLTNVTYSALNGGYLSFDGINGGSGLLDSSKYSTPYTGKTVFIAGKLTVMDGGSFRAMIGSGSGGRNFNLYMYSPSSGVYQLHYSAGGAGSFSTNLSYTAGNWFTAAVTHSTGNVVTYYFNGVQLNQITQTFTQYSASTEYVGRADNFWNGPLSVVGVYKSALTGAEILANHAAVKGRYGLA